jgi:hypothetical protein
VAGAREQGSRTNRTGTTTSTRCPSAPFTARGATVFGIVLGSVREPQVRFLPQILPASPDLLRQATPAEPDEVFRTSAPCARRRCIHFSQESCELASRVVSLLPIVTDEAPPCAIRDECTWWHQERAAACMRCPQVIRKFYGASEEARQTAGSPEALEREEEKLLL